ncbi:aspartyl protease family protein [Sphingomonas sp. 2R-10]|uniref:aspartyl protease family protein n=1 Tax=Sphingomonas sp. 2R-10 TaxID=3045148 RepID=UPI000F77FCFD|nr:aspartyl protease family protein [Sphingomonas sp. 2R-10]MDJ0276418.1 aspartyl protease family protein [Sphingomonas sp. 2R-10]
MLAIVMSLAVMAQAAPPAAPPVASTAAEPMRRDGKGRPVVVATIDGRPVDVVIDTAAGSTIMRDDAARALGLVPADGTIGVRGVAGAEEVRLYRVGRFGNRLFDLRDAEIPGVSSIGATDAQVIAGVDLFEGRRLVFDGVRDEVRVEPSGPTPAGFVAVRGEYVPGEGLVVPVTLNGVLIRGLIDTGAQGSVAGSDVLRAIGWEADDSRLAPYGQIRGAAGGGSAAQVATMDSVKIGPAIGRNVRVVFADGLGGGEAGDPPTMIVGLDLLAALQVYALDFPRGELHLRKPPSPVAPAR